MRGYSLAVVLGCLTAMALPLQTTGFQGTLRASAAVAQGPGQVGSSQDRDQIESPALAGAFLGHWTTREVLSPFLFTKLSCVTDEASEALRLSNKPQNHTARCLETGFEPSPADSRGCPTAFSLPQLLSLGARTVAGA